MSYKLKASPDLPTGALVSVWARTAFASATVSGSPPASPVFTGVMGRSTLSVPGLTDGRPYVAHASVAGQDRYTEFHSEGPWRVVRSNSTGLTAAAAVAKYVGSVAVGSSTTGAHINVFPGTLLAEHGAKFRLRSAGYSAAGASDPTSTLRFSLYEATLTPNSAGTTIALGTELAASAVTGIAPTPRGAVVRGESTSFVIDTTKDYAIVTEVLTAALPASVTFTGQVEIIAA